MGVRMTDFSFGKLPRWAMAMLGLLMLIGAAAEVFVTWLLVEHVPWLGWPLTALTVAGLVFAVVHRLRRGRAVKT
jgi:hypothetical protein